MAKNLDIMFKHHSMIQIHFRYASRPKKGFPEEHKAFGGMLGGHIYIQINDYVYGFQPADYSHYHLIPRKPYNAVYTKQQPDKWWESERKNKLLTINIPLTAKQQHKINEILEKYHQIPPYDYAVLGMRCASSTYHILSRINVFHSSSIIKSWILNPIPRCLRKKLVKKAIQSHWNMKIHHGSYRGVWEKTFAMTNHYVKSKGHLI